MKKTIKVNVYINGDFHRKASVTATEGNNFWNEVKERLYQRFENSTIGADLVALKFNAASKVLSINDKNNFD